MQLGGGIRDLDTIEKYIDGGLRYVIIGTAAVKNPGFLKDACSAFGGHIIVGLDAKDGKVATDGWSKLTGHEVVDLARKFEDWGVESIVYTDIGRDGMLTGINIEATVKLAQALTIPVIASGGLSRHGRHREAVRGRGRGHRGRDLRPRDLLGRPRFRPGPGQGRRTRQGRLSVPRLASGANAVRSTPDPQRTPFAMLAKRIIPCLDVTGGRVVKGVNFVELRDAGDPVEIAARYNEQGADELTFLDITATSDGRDLILPSSRRWPRRCSFR